MSNPLHVHVMRKHFVFPGAGWIATNNAASTQPPHELLELHGALARAQRVGDLDLNQAREAQGLLVHRHILSRSVIGSPPRWMSGFPDGSRSH